MGKSDPYAIISVGTQTFQSKTVMNNLNPNFNENFTFQWNGIDSLQIVLMDKDFQNESDFMGQIVINLSDIKYSKTKSYNEYLKEVPRGSVQFQVKFQTMKKSNLVGSVKNNSVISILRHLSQKLKLNFSVLALYSSPPPNAFRHSFSTSLSFLASSLSPNSAAISQEH